MSFSKEWIDILNNVNKALNTSRVWFRGMSDASFKLNSGVFRETKTRDELLALEKANYYLFRNMGMLDHEKNDWDLLYIMQHHGVKTRLLDWTESFAVALFFAYSTWEQKSDAVVWILNPKQLNYINTGTNGYKVLGSSGQNYLKHILNNKNDASIAIFPIKNNKRVIAQQGVFTIQGNKMVPLEEEQDGRLITEGILKKIVIPKELAPDVETFLKLSGINYYSLFPDLDGLAKYINNPRSLNNMETKKEIIPDIPDEIVPLLNNKLAEHQTTQQSSSASSREPLTAAPRI